MGLIAEEPPCNADILPLVYTPRIADFDVAGSAVINAIQNLPNWLMQRRLSLHSILFLFFLYFQIHLVDFEYG